MDQNILLLNFIFAIRLNHIQEAHNILTDGLKYQDQEFLNNIIDDKLEKIINPIQKKYDTLSKTTKQEITQKIEKFKNKKTKLLTIINSTEIVDIAKLLELTAITIEQLYLIREIIKNYNLQEVKEVFPYLQKIREYQNKFNTSNIQNSLFGIYPNIDDLKTLVDFYSTIEKLTKEIQEEKNNLIQAALENQIWKKDFYKKITILENNVKNKVETSLYNSLDKFVKEFIDIKEKTKTYKIEMPKICSDDYYNMIARTNIYENYINAKYPLANIEKFKNNIMLSLHERAKDTTYYRYFNFTKDKIESAKKFNAKNIFTETKENLEKELHDEINKYMQIGENSYNKLSQAIIKSEKIKIGLETKKQMLNNKIYLLQYDLFGAVAEQLNIINPKLANFKNQIESIVVKTKKYTRDFRKIAGQAIDSIDNKKAYLQETFILLYQETKLPFLSIAPKKNLTIQEITDKSNLLLEELKKTNSVYNNKYAIDKNFTLQQNFLEVISSKNINNFFARIVLLIDSIEHKEFFKKFLLQNGKYPKELTSEIDAQYTNAFGLTKEKQSELTDKIKQIQKQYSLPQDGIIGNNISFIKKDAGKFFHNQILHLEKNYNVATLAQKPLPETYIYLFKKSLEILSKINNKPEWKPKEVNSFYLDIVGKQSTQKTTEIIKQFQIANGLGQTGLIDQAALEKIANLLETGLVYTTTDAKQKYKRLKEKSEQAKNRIEAFTLQKNSIQKTEQRYKNRQKIEIEKIKNLIVSEIGNYSALYRKDKFVFDKSELFFLEKKGEKTNTIVHRKLKELLPMVKISIDSKKNIPIYDVTQPNENFSNVTFEFESRHNPLLSLTQKTPKPAKFKEIKENITIPQDDGSIIDKFLYQYKLYWQAKQKADNIEKELQKALELKEKHLNNYSIIKSKIYPYVKYYSYLWDREKKLHLVSIPNNYRTNKFEEAIKNFLISNIKTFFPALSGEVVFTESFTIKRKGIGEIVSEGMGNIKRTHIVTNYDNIFNYSYVYGKLISSFEHMTGNKESEYTFTDYTVRYFLTKEKKELFLKRLNERKKIIEPLWKIYTETKKYLQFENKDLQDSIRNQKNQINQHAENILRPKMLRALDNVVSHLTKIYRTEKNNEYLRNAVDTINGNLKEVESRINQQNQLLLNKEKINSQLIEDNNIANEINVKKQLLENLQIGLNRVDIATNEINAQLRSLREAMTRTKNQFTQRIIKPTKDIIENAIAISAAIPTSINAIVPDVTATINDKELFQAAARQADIIQRAGANATLDFKQATIKLNSRFKDEANRLALAFHTEKRKIDEYGRKLKIELCTNKNAKAIKAQIKRNNLPAMATALAQVQIKEVEEETE